MSDADLLAKIKALEARLARATSDADDDDPGPTGKIPGPRFAQHRQQLREIRDELSGLKTAHTSRITEMEAAHAAALKAAREEAAKSVADVARRGQEDIALVESGIRDATVRDMLRSHVARLPEADRKDGAAGWLKSRRAALDAHRADPEKVAAPEPMPWLDAYIPAPSKAADPAPVVPRVGDIDRDAGPRREKGLTLDTVQAMAPSEMGAYLGWGPKRGA